MKTIYLFLISVLLIQFGKAQIIYSEDFSDGIMPAGYVLYNLDGLTPDDPDLITMADSAWTIKQISAQSFPGGKCAFSVSWYVNDAGPSDDWMVLPAITLGSDPYLSWLAMAITSSGNFRDRYQVFVATTGNTINDYVLLSPVFDTGNQGELPQPTVREISLASFANQTVYIAFRNWTQPYNSQLPTGPGNGGNELAIDNITVSQGPVSVGQPLAEHNGLRAWPNPCSNFIVLDMPAQSTGSCIEILDHTGRLSGVHCANAGGPLVVDTSEWGGGSYLLRFQNARETVRVVKR